jgi:cell division inhibitor SepF
MPGAIRKLGSFLGLVENDEFYDEDMIDETPVSQSTVRDLPVRSTPTPAIRPVAPVAVEPEPAARIVKVSIHSFNDAARIGEEFKRGHAVIMNCQDLNDTQEQRIVDYASGLVHGCEGNLERITRGVFLVSPKNLDVHDMARATIANDGFFNQS